jgi:hypothetical protein
MVMVARRRGGVEAVAVERFADRGRGDPQAKVEQLALDPLVAPARILGGQADELLHVLVERGSPAPAAAGEKGEQLDGAAQREVGELGEHQVASRMWGGKQERRHYRRDRWSEPQLTQGVPAFRTPRPDGRSAAGARPHKTRRPGRRPARPVRFGERGEARQVCEQERLHCRLQPHR